MNGLPGGYGKEHRYQSELLDKYPKCHTPGQSQSMRDFPLPPPPLILKN